MPQNVIWVPMTRKDIDQGNADAELCDFLKKQLPNVNTLKDLYKQGYHLALKIDTLHQSKDQVEEQLFIVSDETYKAAKKRLRRNWLQDFWDRNRFVLGVVSGALVATIITVQTIVQ